MALIPARLAKVMTLDNRDFHIVYIEEKGGPRHFTIEIGVVETVALARKIEPDRRESARPLTHDLLLNAITSLGAHVREIRITALKSGTYYAELVLDTDDGEVVIDSRPSDALVLGAIERCDLLVEESVFEAASRPG